MGGLCLIFSFSQVTADPYYPPLEHNYDRFYDGLNIIFGDNAASDDYLALGPGRYSVEMTGITIFDESWDLLQLGTRNIENGDNHYLSDFGIQVRHDNISGDSFIENFYRFESNGDGAYDDVLTYDLGLVFTDLNHFSLRYIFEQNAIMEPWQVSTFYRLHGEPGYSLAGSFTTPNFDLNAAQVFLNYECAEGAWARASISAVPEPSSMIFLGIGLVLLSIFGRKKFKR
jgi:hypothetical protein